MTDSQPSSDSNQADFTEEELAAMSGLRNPVKAARGLAAAALSLEALSVLLAIAPMRMLLDDSGGAITALVVLFVGCVALASQAGKPWVWKAGMGLQAVFILCAVFHVSLGIAGIVFALTWAYCWKIARELGRPPRRDASNPNYSPKQSPQ